jgi:polysaccharide deacetylase family protein (PEP-CTERM system associated)
MGHMVQRTRPARIDWTRDAVAASEPPPHPSSNGGSPGRLPAPPGMHILTVALEDYFHVAPFKSLIDRKQWYRFEMRLEASTRRTLDFLDEFGVRATFFVLGWVAEAVPELLREVTARGHEVASKGYYHRDIRQLDRQEFRDDVLRARDALQRATGMPVLGYRVPQGWFEKSDLWALEVLAEAGMVYDSSVRLVLRSYASEPWRRFPHWPQVSGRPFLEVPLSSIRLFGLDLPIAGGNYFRQFPDAFMRRAVAHWNRHYQAPYVMYFHTWELDAEQPRISAASLKTRIRQYRNLEKMPAMLGHYFKSYRFTSIAQYFGLEAGASAQTQPPASSLNRAVLEWESVPGREAPPTLGRADPLPVTLVVPCYNEEQSLRYLSNTLESVVRKLGRNYALQVLFVDDCSTDGTWAALQAIFGSDPRCRFVRHERNRGVAAAIQTGIAHATTEVVCSIDCDCTYDPHELVGMIPLLTDNVDLVTASPYHPRGGVKNVPEWRLLLSRSLSGMYRVILHQKLATYTSCFRVYRRRALLPMQLDRPGFLGIAEMLGKLDLAGSKIVEYPTVLQVRLLGHSKMKILRTIIGHLGVLASLTRLRLWGAKATGAGTPVLRDPSSQA